VVSTVGGCKCSKLRCNPPFFNSTIAVGLASRNEVSFHSTHPTLAKIALIGSLLCFMTLPVLADLNDGLVAYYPFDGNANDESGNGNHGVESAPLSFITGHEGLAVELSGSESIAADPAINSNTSFTVTAWVKPYEIATTGAQTIVMERDAGGRDSCGRFSAGNYGVQIYHGKFAFAISTIMQNGFCYHSRIFSSFPVEVEQYSFLTARYDQSSSKIELFINGNLYSAI